MPAAGPCHPRMHHARLAWLLPIAVLLTASTLLHAQATITLAPRQCVFHAGDDSAWAAPGLDESGWQPYTQWKLNPVEPRYWVRCHADLSPLRGVRDPAVLVGISSGAYQLFVNGEPVGGSGDLRTGDFSKDSIRAFPLRQPLPADAVIAFRLTYWTFLGLSESTVKLAARVGDPNALRDRRAGIVLEMISPPLRAIICYGVIAVLGFVLLVLYLNDRSRSELLLLSLNCIGVATIYLDLAASWMLMDFSASVFEAIFGLGMVLSGVAYPWFFFRLVQRRVPRFFWVIVVLAVLDHALFIPAAFLSHTMDLRVAWFYIYWAAPVGFAARVAMASAPFIAFWPYPRIARRMRPLAALCMVWAADQMLFFFVHLTELNIPGVPNLYPRWNPVLIETEPISSFCVVAALIWLLLREQRRVADERALLAGEMRAASEIQGMLAPARVDAAPGLKIDVAFHPMREVGGDFYLCRVLPDGRQRVLLGDVSGKGAAAAMAATLLIGAAGEHDFDSPSKLLARLNRVFHENRLTGFATCVCADIAPGGEVLLASAGHLAPYYRGEELKVAPGLPLGIAGDSEYAQSALVLDPGETLTLLSDGVVEARNAAGELFGFERACALTAQTADQIARTAQQFGQEDDITVLSVTCAAKLEEVPAI